MAVAGSASDDQRLIFNTVSRRLLGDQGVCPRLVIAPRRVLAMGSFQFEVSKLTIGHGVKESAPGSYGCTTTPAMCSHVYFNDAGVKASIEQIIWKAP